MATAAARFEELLGRLPPARLDPENRTTAVIRLRLGLARLAIGDTEGALDAIQAALAGLPSATAGERQEIARVYQDLARAHELLGEFPEARAAYQRSMSLSSAAPDVPEELALQVALARVSIFDDPELARRTLDQLLPAAERTLLAGQRKTDRDVLGDIYSLRGRVELNAGRLGEAEAWFGKALKMAGGLSEKVTVSDLRIRSDLAIINFLLGKKDEVRRYLVHTGAGRLNNDLGFGTHMRLPSCGESTGVRPDDMAVLEFAITSVGRVTGTMPVYTSRPGIASAFVRAVSGWTWSPEDLAGIDPFWRASIRLELRCSDDTSPPDLSPTFDSAADAWFAAQGLEPVNVGVRSRDETLALLRSELRRRKAQQGENSAQLLPVLSAMIRRRLDQDEWEKVVPRMRSLLRAAGAPIEARVVSEIAWRNAEIMKQLPKKPDPVVFLSKKRESFSELLAELRKSGEDQGRAGAFVRAELAAVHGTSALGEARQLYREIVNIPVAKLSARDPIRKAAMLQLVAIDEIEKAPQGRTIPCAFADPIPLPINERIGDEAFPREAMTWGFSGWVRVSFDIDAAGQPAHVRTAMAYPPFIFGPATEKAVARFRYQPFPGSAGVPGCSNATRQVRYVIAG